MPVIKPRVGISQCLLGDRVRYDGGHKRAADLLAALSHLVEWVPVCPEVEIGMGTPREPIQLVSDLHGVRAGLRQARLVGVDNGVDWTERMVTFARRRIAELVTLRLCGFVLKRDSPSCGLDDVTIVDRAGNFTRDGRGLFAQALVEALPEMPVADEQQLHDPVVVEHFLREVLAYCASRSRAG